MKYARTNILSITTGSINTCLEAGEGKRTLDVPSLQLLKIDGYQRLNDGNFKIELYVVDLDVFSNVKYANVLKMGVNKAAWVCSEMVMN